MQKTIFKKDAYAVVILFFLVSALFIYTLYIRKPWFTSLLADTSTEMGGHHQWLTASSVKFVRNWYAENPFKIFFSLLGNPSSIEFSSLQDREPYISYPPGAILPIYLISILTVKEPDVLMISSFNLLNHYLIALILTIISFILLRKSGLSTYVSFIFSLIPGLLELLLPPPLYWHQKVYFSDQAVILPYAFLILLELLKDSTNGIKTKRNLAIIQSITIIYGTLTDWLFVFLMIFLYLKRLIMNQLGHFGKKFFLKSFLFWWPVATSIAFYFIQVFYLQKGLTPLVDKLLFRTGISRGNEVNAQAFNQGFWINIVKEGYGDFGLWTIMISLVLFLSFGLYLIYQLIWGKKKIAKHHIMLVLYGMLFTIPIFFQIYFFRNHSYIHDFSALKISLFMATVPFVINPAILLISIFTIPSIKNSYKQIISHSAAIFILAVAILYVFNVHPRFKKFYPMPNPTVQIIGESVRGCTKFEDVVFSSEIEIPKDPPHMLSYSMKRVYAANSLEDVKFKLDNLNLGKRKYNIVFLSTDPKVNLAGLDQVTLTSNFCNNLYIRFLTL